MGEVKGIAFGTENEALGKYDKYVPPVIVSVSDELYSLKIVIATPRYGELEGDYADHRNIWYDATDMTETFEVVFENPILNCTRRMDYLGDPIRTIWNNCRDERGSHLVIVEKSDLLDRALNMLANKVDSEDWLASVKHYCIIGSDEIIDVITAIEPEIRNYF